MSRCVGWGRLLCERIDKESSDCCDEGWEDEVEVGIEQRWGGQVDVELNREGHDRQLHVKLTNSSVTRPGRTNRILYIPTSQVCWAGSKDMRDL